MKFLLAGVYRCFLLSSISVVITALLTVQSVSGSSVYHNANNDTEQSSMFTNLAANLWGNDNVWIPSPTVAVQYEEDLGERSRVDFDKGIAMVQILLSVDVDHNSDLVRAHLRQGVGNLILGNAGDPLDILETFVATKKRPVLQDDNGNRVPPRRETRVYITRRGDSLWKVAQRFYMTVDDLVALNDIQADTVISIGRPLKVRVFSSHDLTLEASFPKAGTKPLLLDQIRMVDGRPVPHWMVEEFAADVIADEQQVEIVIGADGVRRKAVSVQFKLVTNHLEVRARKYRPLVKAYAVENDIEPALVMAIIHTESKFNPLARSQAPAYGLMQLVPHTGAVEAYHRLYGKKEKISAQYLYDPKNNIELGAKYFSILKDNYMRDIENEQSRSYCAVAAYNTGASNVGRAFIAKKSFVMASPAINSMPPKAVYDRLIAHLPDSESRNYVKKVVDRTQYYKKFQ